MRIEVNEPPPPPAPAAGLVPALARGLALLELLARRREPAGLALLAQELQAAKSSVHALCNTLLALGYLRREPDGYLIGPRILHLAEAFVAGTDVAREFNRMWSDGRPPPEDTVVLSVLDGLQTVYVAVRNSARPLDLVFNVGMRLPAHLTGSGKAVLAWLPPAELKRRLGRRSLARPNGRGPVTPAELLAELATIRARGWSMDDQTSREGVASLAAPVFDAAGAAVAGVGLCINTARLGPAKRTKLRDEAVAIAADLTRRIGGAPP